MKKKFYVTLGLFLTLILICSVASAENYIERGLLESLGIIEEDYTFEETVTRAEFIHFSLKLLGEKTLLPADSENPFSDVNDKTDYKSDIISAYKMSLVSLNDDKKFNPDEEITVNEVSKILTTILGYSDFAKMNGGYPGGYYSAAAKYGVFDDCEFNSGDILTSGDLIKVLYNTLNAKVVGINSISGNEGKTVINYEKSYDDETLLNKNFDIYEIEGIVNSNSYATVLGNSPAGKGKVEITGVVYDAGKTDADEFLGLNIKAYYKGIGTSKTLVYVCEYDNEVTEIKYDDIIPEKTEFSKVFYYANDKEKSKKINRTATLIVNGTRTSFDDVKKICPSIGNVRLIDNDIDGTVDVIIVEDYTMMRVTGKSNNTVYDETSKKSVEINDTNGDSDFTTIIYKDGKKADYNAIDIDDILLIAQDDNAKSGLRKVLVSSKKISGNIVEIYDDKVVIDEEYEFVDGLKDKLYVGLKGDFYLDTYGRIAYIKCESQKVYGYLNDMYKSEERKDSVVLKIFTENGRWVKLELSDKVKHNGEREKITAQKFYDTYYNSDKNKFRQLITYTVDDNAKIQEINFAQNFDGDDLSERNAVANDTFRQYISLNSATYRTAMNSLGNSLLLKGETIIFNVPLQTGDGEADDSDFFILSPGALLDGESYTNIYGYDEDESYRVGAVVLLGSGKKVDGKSSVAVVESVLRIWSDDGETIGISCNYAGSNVKIPIKSNDAALAAKVASLDSGDVIQAGFDNAGYINAIDVIYKTSDGYEQKFLRGSIYSNTTKIAGEVLYYNPDTNIIKIDYGNVGFFGTASLKNILVFNTKHKKVSLGEKSDIEVGKFVCLSVRNYLVQEAVIYNKE